MTDSTKLGLFNYEDGNGFLLGMNAKTGQYEKEVPDDFQRLLHEQRCVRHGLPAAQRQAAALPVTRDDTGEEYYSHTIQNAGSPFGIPPIICSTTMPTAPCGT